MRGRRAPPHDAEVEDDAEDDDDVGSKSLEPLANVKRKSTSRHDIRGLERKLEPQ